MTIPRYQRQVGPSGEGTMPRVPVDDSMAQALGMAAGQLQKVAGQMYEQAAKQQDDIRAVEFAKLKGEVDASFNEFYLQETQNPDYEGIKERGKTFQSEKKAQMLEGIKDKQVRMAMEKYLATKQPAMDLDLTKLYLAKQKDHRNAVFSQAYEQNVLNNDRAGLASLVEGATWLNETQRQSLLSKGGREISWNSAMKDMRANLDGWTFDGEKYPGLDEQQAIQLKDQHETLLDRRDRDIERAKRKVYEQNDEELWTIYNAGGRESLAELNARKARGGLDAQSVAQWDRIFKQRIEEAANRQERMANRTFRKMYEGATPIEREYLDLSHDYGVTRSEVDKTYTELMKDAENGTLTSGKLNGALENGKLGPILAGRIKDRYKIAHDKWSKVYGINVRENKQALGQTLKALNIPGATRYQIEFEELTVDGSIPKDQLDDLRRGVVKKAIDENGGHGGWGQRSKLWKQYDKEGAFLPDQPIEEDFF